MMDHDDEDELGARAHMYVHTYINIQKIVIWTYMRTLVGVELLSCSKIKCTFSILTCPPQRNSDEYLYSCLNTYTPHDWHAK